MQLGRTNFNRHKWSNSFNIIGNWSIRLSVAFRFSLSFLLAFLYIMQIRNKRNNAIVRHGSSCVRWKLACPFDTDAAMRCLRSITEGGDQNCLHVLGSTGSAQALAPYILQSRKTKHFNHPRRIVSAINVKWLLLLALLLLLLGGHKMACTCD